MIHEMRIRYSFIGSLALLTAAGAGSPLWSQETVWRIGTFDHASAEFGGRGPISRWWLTLARRMPPGAGLLRKRER